MCEHVYAFYGLHSPEWEARFSDDHDGISCLCTFPGNDAALGRLSAERVRGLAMLGAAVALAHNAPEMVVPDSDDDSCLGIFLPDGLPKWIQNEIVRLVRDEE